MRKPKTNVVLPHSGLVGTGPARPLGIGRARMAVLGASGEYELMKSRETLIRLRKFQVDEKRRRVAQIESMVADFDRMAADLEREISDRAGPRRHPRSDAFRLSDLRQGGDRPARQSQALGR